MKSDLSMIAVTEGLTFMLLQGVLLWEGVLDYLIMTTVIEGLTFMILHIE